MLRDASSRCRAAAVLLGAALGMTSGGCVDGEPPPTSSGPTAPAGQPSGLVLPTAADAQRPEAELDAELARRFLVSDEVAARYALGLARDKGHLSSDARVCARWQRVGQDDSLLATEHLVGTGPECERWSAVLAWARSAAQQHGDVVALQRASGSRFFTVAVSPYTFHHPLYEGQAGLPTWVLRAAQTDPGAVPWRCEPRAVRERSGPSAPELAAYDCASGPVGFEHLGAKEVTTGIPTARIDALSGFKRWQRALRGQYADDIPARIERLEQLWTRYPQESQP